MSILAKQIRKKITKEEHLKNLINNLEWFIWYCNKKSFNNVNEIFLKSSEGWFKFENKNRIVGFKLTKTLFEINNDNFSFDKKTLNYINALWEIILKIRCETGPYGNEKAVVEYDFRNNSKKEETIFNLSGEEVSAVEASIKASEYYFINFNHFKGFEFSDEKFLIDTIDDKYLSDLFYLYKNSKLFDEKYSHLSNICKKLVFLFQKKDSPPKTYNFIKTKLGENLTSEFCGKMHGYFRHTDNDSKGIEAKEWGKLTDEKKSEICEEFFIDLLHILALLRIKGLLPKIK